MDASFPEQVGPYRLLHPLGSGGMATVYAAEHVSEGRHVALKLLNPIKAAQDPTLCMRFLDEAEILKSLQIPGVVCVLDSACHADIAFLAMEWLRGQTLREWMGQPTRPVPLEDARRLGARLADILAEVHDRGVTHRDLKPENIFLCSPEDGPLASRVKLLDFGIAKPPPQPVDALGTTQVHTQEPAKMGTLPYMSPERLRSTPHVAPSMDVYALGTILFELLAGRRPFVAKDDLDLFREIVSEEPPLLREFVPTLPSGLDVFIRSMLAKEPERRPSMRRCRDVLNRAWEEAPDDCPLPGLAAFTEAHAELFFGRDREVRALLESLARLREGPRRWLQVEGRGGVGKSSLIQAGLLPRLSPAEGWHVVCVRPRDEPLRALARALASGPWPLRAGESAETVAQALRLGGGALHDFTRAHTPPGCCLLLVIDPLEELVTLGAAECSVLAELLSSALEAPDSPLRLLTSVRADFLHRLEQVPLLARHFRSAARSTLEPLGLEALEQVVQGMDQRTGMSLSDELAHGMVQEAHREAGGLSLLGHALRELWARSGGARLTRAHYERLGGMGGALTEQAEVLLDSLGPEGRERARWILLSLVLTSPGGSDTRRPRSRRDVIAMAGGDSLAEEVLRRLSGGASGIPGELAGLRLVQLSGGADAAEQRVELVHELLLHRVRSIAGWIEQERMLLERRASLERVAHDWHKAGGEVEALPTGSLLAHYRAGAVAAAGATVGHRQDSLEVVHFLQAARALERRRTLTRRLLAAAAGLAVLVIVFSAVRANQARQQAEEAQLRAEEAQRQSEASLKQVIARMNEFTGTSDWKLSWLAFTREVRLEMLEGFRQSLAELTPQQRELPEVRRAAIQVFQRSADFALLDGKLSEASQFLDEAEAELAAAFTAQPRDGALLELRALQFSKRGKVELAQGELFRACGRFAQAVGGFKRPEVVSDDPVDDRRTLAVSLSELAECHIALQQWEIATDLLAQAVQLHEQNGQSYNKALLAQVHGKQGDIALATHQPVIARAEFDRALELGWSSVVEASAGDQYSPWVLAQLLVEDARFRAGQRQLRVAEDEAREAKELSERLLEGEPESKRYALVWLDAMSVLETLARERTLASQRHAERCARARDFLKRDDKDVRFMPSDCSEARPRVEAR